MDSGIDYGKELEKARKRAARCGHKGTEDALEAHWEVCCGDVLLAEENLRNQGREWENASLARDFLASAQFLEGYDKMPDLLYTAIQRMRRALSDHPRLAIELLELERSVLRRIEARCDHELQAGEEVEDELAFYRHNVECADTGCFSRIRSKGGLKRDPMEWSADYERIIDEANKQIYTLLEGYPRGMGFCHAYWSTKKRLLKTRYGLEWHSPPEMNPGVMFD